MHTTSIDSASKRHRNAAAACCSSSTSPADNSVRPSLPARATSIYSGSNLDRTRFADKLRLINRRSARSIGDARRGRKGHRGSQTPSPRRLKTDGRTDQTHARLAGRAGRGLHRRRIRRRTWIDSPKTTAWYRTVSDDPSIRCPPTTRTAHHVGALYDGAAVDDGGKSLMINSSYLLASGGPICVDVRCPTRAAWSERRLVGQSVMEPVRYGRNAARGADRVISFDSGAVVFRQF